MYILEQQQSRATLKQNELESEGSFRGDRSISGNDTTGFRGDESYEGAVQGRKTRPRTAGPNTVIEDDRVMHKKMVTTG